MTGTTPTSTPLLSVRNLVVEFPTDDGPVHAVNDVSFDVDRGETVALVGESGSGKTVTSLSVLGLLPKKAKVSGEILLDGTPLTGAPESELRTIRGKRVAMIFQDALAALNPVYTVGFQIAEAIQVHDDLTKRQAHDRATELLDIVGIPNPTARVEQYPHEYSGGMRQRAVIAMAIANEPDLLIADEPTTALDVTIQAQVLDTLERIQQRTSSAIMLVTHDLGVVAGVADRVLVMYAGRQIEQGSVEQIFYETQHPYTLGLLASLPRLDRRADSAQRLFRIQGQPPSLLNVPPGCAFHPRCLAREVPGRCDTLVPELRDFAAGHRAACHRAGELSRDELLSGPAVESSGAAS